VLDRLSVRLSPHQPRYRWQSALSRLLLLLFCLGFTGVQVLTVVRAAPFSSLAAAVTCTDLVENGDFETDNQVWLPSPNTNLAPSYSSDLAFSGTQSLRLGPDPGVPMAASLSEVHYAQPLQLPPASTATITLNFRYATFYEDSQDSDQLQAEIFDANTNESLQKRTLLNTKHAWLLQQINLAPFAGRAISLYFRVRNNGTLGRTWMYLDKVEILYCSTTPLPPTNTPASTSVSTAIATPTLTPATATSVVSSTLTSVTKTPVSSTLTPATRTPVSSTLTPATVTPVPPTPIPPTATPVRVLPECNNILPNSSFETDGDWTFGDDPNPGYYSGNQHHEGYRSILLGHAPETGLADQKSYSSIRQLVALPSNTITVQLRWWHLYQTQAPQNENPSTSSDRQEVILLSPSQKVLSIVKRVLRNETSWGQDVVDLTPYRGKSFYLYFNAYNDGDSVRTWAYIDEVQLCVNYSAAPALPPSPTPLPLPTASFTPLPTNTPATIPTNTPISTATPLPATLPATLTAIRPNTPLAQAAPVVEATQALPTAETPFAPTPFAAPTVAGPTVATLRQAPATQALPVTVEPVTVEANLDYLAVTATAAALANTARLIPAKIVSTYVPPRWGVGLGTIAVLFGVAIAIILLASFWVRLSNRERLLIGILAAGFLIWWLLRLYRAPA